VRQPAIVGSLLAGAVIVGVVIGATASTAFQQARMVEPAPPAVTVADISAPPTSATPRIVPTAPPPIAVEPTPTLVPPTLAAQPTAASPTSIPAAPLPSTLVGSPNLVVRGTGSDGLVVRRTPGGDRIASTVEGEPLIDLSERAQAGRWTWRRVRTLAGAEGWVAADFIASLIGPVPSPPAVAQVVPTPTFQIVSPTVIPTSAAVRAPPPAAPAISPGQGAISAPSVPRPEPPTPTPTSAPAITGPRIPYPGNGGGPTLCADGSVSNSSGRGTCSHHGGIAGGSRRRR
jgi:hypothetical protein